MHNRVNYQLKGAMDRLNALWLLAIFACSTQVWAGSPDTFCNNKFPNLEAPFCYENCPASYTGVGPVCWAKCPDNTIDIGAVCTKETYVRETNVPRICAAGREIVAGLCVKTCDNGYKDTGVACVEKCPSGYADLGVTCFLSFKVKSRTMKGCNIWQRAKCSKKCGKKCDKGYSNYGCVCKRKEKTQTKKVVDKGEPKAMQCASDEEQQVGICYPHCRNSYNGVLNVCWAECSGDTTDTGTQCQKNTELRKGTLAACFSLPTCASFDTRCDPFYEAFESAKGVEGKIATGVCAGMYLMIRKQLEVMKTFSKCAAFKDWNVVSVSFSLDAAIGIAGVVEYGIAVDITSNKGICFVGFCYGVTSDVEVGASINFGIWKSMDSIPGESKVFAAGAEIPVIELGPTGSAVFANPSMDFIGVVGSGGVGTGVNPVSASFYRCDTPQKFVTTFTQAS